MQKYSPNQLSHDMIVCKRRCFGNPILLNMLVKRSTGPCFKFVCAKFDIFGSKFGIKTRNHNMSVFDNERSEFC